MRMDGGTVMKLHRACDAALVAVAKAHGFTYVPGTMRYTDIKVSGRMQFVMAGQEQVLASQSNAYAVTAHKVGDTVTIKGEAYVIEKFTPRQGSHIRRVRDGKKFRCRQGAYDMNAGAGLDEAQIKAVIRGQAPGLNRNAVKRMLGSMQWETVKTPMTATAQVQAWVTAYMAKAEAEAKSHPVPGTHWDATQMLNESADELAWEAKVS
jgi:hypothetical protein